MTCSLSVSWQFQLVSHPAPRPCTDLSVGMMSADAGDEDNHHRRENERSLLDGDAEYVGEDHGVSVHVAVRVARGISALQARLVNP